MLISNTTAITAAISAVTAAGITILATRPEHDLARSAGVLGAIAGLMGAATIAHYRLMDRRLCRVEALGNRIVTVDQAVLGALIDGGDEAAAIP